MYITSMPAIGISKGCNYAYVPGAYLSFFIPSCNTWSQVNIHLLHLLIFL